jgi:heparan-alpha-glucosaminide N-acetyltransferase
MSTAAVQRPLRVISIDAARGLVMFTMIFVNDMAGVSHSVVPDWMRHFHGKSGITFVDMVFPAFLFIVGMSIPSALGRRVLAAEPTWKIFLHVIARTLSLLIIGVMMVNDESPGTNMSSLSPDMWTTLMFLSAIFAFCSVKNRWQWIASVVRALGAIGLVVLAFMFRGDKGQPIITLSPFVIHTSWFGILGLIAWAYLVGTIVYLTFRNHRVALLGCMVLLLCLYPADKAGAFDGFWLNRYVGVGDMLGALPSITVGGLLLASILPPSGTLDLPARLRFTTWFILGCAAGAWLLTGLYGINKNAATPAWCLWACVITAVVWLIFHCLCDLGPVHPIGRIFALAGQNVLLAYLLSEMLPSLLTLLRVDQWYDKVSEIGLTAAIIRSAGMAVFLLAATVGLNRVGFRLKI